MTFSRFHDADLMYFTIFPCNFRKRLIILEMTKKEFCELSLKSATHRTFIVVIGLQALMSFTMTKHF